MKEKIITIIILLMIIIIITSNILVTATNWQKAENICDKLNYDETQRMKWDGDWICYNITKEGYKEFSKPINIK